MEVVPQLAADEPLVGVSALDVERALRLAGGRDGELVELPVELGGVALVVEVERVVGELVAHEVVDLACLLDLALLVVELAQCHVGAPIGAEDLAFESCDLEREDVGLMLPFGEPAVPA